MASQSIGGFGQKAAIVVAASGMAMAVAVPTASTTVAGEPALETNQPSSSSSGALAQAAKDTTPAVTASGSATVSFVRSDLSSSFDPEKKLASVVTAAGEAEPAVTDETLDMPVAASNMTSGFGVRTSPITGAVGEMHTGQDFGIACGTGVLAAAEGIVKEAGWHPFGGGNRVVIDHGGGMETTYNHLSSISVSSGQTVARGQTVGGSGTTGSSTGCHLHFEVVVNGQAVDPLGWL